MPDTLPPESLYRLMSWLSPSYPVGAFAHSGGLEWAVEERLVTDRETLRAWLEDTIGHGALHNDAVLLVHAHRAGARGDMEALRGIAAFAACCQPSAERRLETCAQGAAFCRIAASSAPSPLLAALAGEEVIAYPVAVGLRAAEEGIALSFTLTAYLHAAAANLISAAQRLVPLGQTDGQIALAALESRIIAAARAAEALPEGDVFAAMGSAALMADFASLAHETQYTRLFRT